MRRRSRNEKAASMLSVRPIRTDRQTDRQNLQLQTLPCLSEKECCHGADARQSNNVKRTTRVLLNFSLAGCIAKKALQSLQFRQSSPLSDSRQLESWVAALEHG